jgi:CRP/FNR family transcriptional regulator, cyclic AMP receptor protein
MEVSLTKTIELIHKISFFDGFNPEDLKELAKLASFQKYQAQENIIEQGSLALHLMFTINGQIDVLVDDVTVVTLKGGGHLFGEMSFVLHSLASATVKAKTDCVVMQFDYDLLNSLNEPIYYRLRLDLYRSCAEVMAKKLQATNAIAKSYIEQEKSVELILAHD